MYEKIKKKFNNLFHSICSFNNYKPYLFWGEVPLAYNKADKERIREHEKKQIHRIQIDCLTYFLPNFYLFLPVFRLYIYG